MYLTYQRALHCCTNQILTQDTKKPLVQNVPVSNISELLITLDVRCLKKKICPYIEGHKTALIAVL